MARKKITWLTKVLLFVYRNPFIFIGLFLISIFLLWRYHNLRILSFKTDDVKIENKSGIKPVYIKAYPVGVDIKVKDASIVNGVWQINPDSGNYLVSSANINDGSNIILYGHNKDSVLGPIRHIAIDAIIELTGNDGKKYLYKVVKKDTVKPDNLDYLQKTDKETLTLYTCVGFLDSERFIVVAEKVDSEHSNSNSMKTNVGNIQKLDYSVKSKTVEESNLIVNNEKRINSYITYYGFNDNDPPGKAIAYPRSDGFKTYHNEASGVGSFSDPVSFASDPNFLSVGTVIYIPYIKKYAIMEDFCATCSKNIKSGRKHIDIWAGGDGSKSGELVKCEEDHTSDSEVIILNPNNSYPVDYSPVCF